MLRLQQRCSSITYIAGADSGCQGIGTPRSHLFQYIIRNRFIVQSHVTCTVENIQFDNPRINHSVRNFLKFSFRTCVCINLIPSRPYITGIVEILNVYQFGGTQVQSYRGFRLKCTLHASQVCEYINEHLNANIGLTSKLSP